MVIQRVAGNTKKPVYKRRPKRQPTTGLRRTRTHQEASTTSHDDHNQVKVSTKSSNHTVELDEEEKEPISHIEENSHSEVVKVIEVAKKKQRVDDRYAQGMDPYDEDEDYYDNEEYDEYFEEEEVQGVGMFEGLPDPMIIMLQEAITSEHDEEDLDENERSLVGLPRFLKQSVQERIPSQNMKQEWKSFVDGLTS